MTLVENKVQIFLIFMLMFQSFKRSYKAKGITYEP